MWRALTQRPSVISECLSQLRTINYLTQQSVLIQQETNLLLRELIVKVTTQPAETPEAVHLSLSEASNSQSTVEQPLGHSANDARVSAAAKPHRVRTERDIVRNTRSSIAADQFQQQAKARYPHREGEVLPSPPTRPFGLP